MNIEVTWKTCGEIVCREISKHVPKSLCVPLIQTVRQMAGIAHDARRKELVEQVKAGTIEPSNIPEWFKEDNPGCCNARDEASLKREAELEYEGYLEFRQKREAAHVIDKELQEGIRHIAELVKLIEERLNSLPVVE